MANGNGFDPLAQYARLSERVENQGKDIIDLRSNMNSGFQGVHASLNALSNEFRNNTKTPWPVIWSAIGVCFAVLVGIGGALYYPVRETMAETKADLRLLGDRSVSVNSFQDFRNTYESNRQISRNEYIDKFNNITGRIDANKEDLQRQIDQLTAQYASTYGARDIILDLRERIDRMERERNTTPP